MSENDLYTGCKDVYAILNCRLVFVVFVLKVTPNLAATRDTPPFGGGKAIPIGTLDQ